MSDDSADGISAIPIAASSFQNFADIYVFFDQLGDFGIGEAFILVLPEEQFIFLIKEVAYFFKYRNGIVKTLWKLSQTHKEVEELIHIGQIEITGQNQVPRSPVVLPHHRVGRFDAVAAICTISQVPKVEFSGKRKIGLSPCRINHSIGEMLLGIAEIFENLGEYITDRIRIN